MCVGCLVKNNNLKEIVSEKLTCHFYTLGKKVQIVFAKKNFSENVVEVYGEMIQEMTFLMLIIRM